MKEELKQRLLKHLLSISNLSKTFDDIKAVDDLSFGVNKGAITTLIGPNGSGKTVTFNLITGFYRPSSSSSSSSSFAGQRLLRKEDQKGGSLMEGGGVVELVDLGLTSVSQLFINAVIDSSIY